MMVEFTPKPWAVHPAEARVDAFNAGEPVPVCAMLWPTEERSEAETYANAALIAAAPDLVEALDNCVTALERATLGNEWDEVFVRSARAALAKARGEESQP